MKKINGLTKFILGVIITVILAVIGLAVAWGAFGNKVNSNTVRIEKVEVKAEGFIDSIARVETKLDFLVDTVKEIEKEVKK